MAKTTAHQRLFVEVFKPVEALIQTQIYPILSYLGPCFPLAGGLCKFYANAGGTQPLQRQLLLGQYKQQANPLLSIHNYTPLVVSKNDKYAVNIIKQT
jgi:hypothetical protein